MSNASPEGLTPVSEPPAPKGTAFLLSKLSTAAAWALFAMMALMLFDVLGRKLINKPILGAVEVGELLLLVMVYASIPLASSSRAHIRIELLDSLVPESLRPLRARLGELFCAVALLGCAWLTLGQAIQAGTQGDSTTLLRIPLWPAQGLVALLLLLDAAVHLAIAAGIVEGDA